MSLRAYRPYRNYRNYGIANRGFGDFYNMIDSFFNDEIPSQKTMNACSFKVDIAEAEDGYTVEAELPGFNKEEIDIHLEEGQLTISAEKTEESDHSDEDKNYIHKERRFSKMSRSMYFKDIDEEHLKAKLDDGILTIEIPKLEKEETFKKISIE